MERAAETSCLFVITYCRKIKSGQKIKVLKGNKNIHFREGSEWAAKQYDA